jgi:hypothetical protein
MLHRKKEIQFNFLMSAIGFINDTAVSASNRDALGAQKKMFYDSKMFKGAQSSFTFLRILPLAGGRRALPLSTLPGYHGHGRSAGRSPSPFPAWGLPSGRCTVTRTDP